MKNLSIVIITKNEERNIGRCLESIISLSDDIIVVDSGSQDMTREICQKHKIKFIVNDFHDYSSQKNFGNNIAKYDYIFSIDADEALSPELYESIKSLSFDPNKNIAFSFNRLSFHCSQAIKHGGWYPDKKTRIWNKKFGQWQGEIHEKLIFDSPPQIAHLNGDLLHYTYYTRDEHINQAKKFSSLNAKSDFKQGKNSNLFLVYFSFVFRFISVYILRLGFLDGKIGYFIAKTTARATFWRKKELLDLNRSKKN